MTPRGIRVLAANLALAVGFSLNLTVNAQISSEDFAADFESGNIADVQQVGVDSFTFAIRLNEPQNECWGWYYFAIANSSNRTATLFLTNPDSWQDQTCNPVFSLDNLSWQRVADVWRQGNWVGFRQYLGADTVWFAQGFPFTVSRMYAYLDTIESSPFVHRATLGYSVHDRPIDMITITDERWSGERKKTAWLISRQHPMESPPTYLLRGLIDGVLDQSEFAERWRRDVVLKVVPIVNVDGVAEGYSRHNVNGINLNRDWQENISAEQPEVRAVHQAIDDYSASGEEIDLFMDLHAAMDNADFGFRMSLPYTSSGYFQNQETFLYLLETHDPWQDRSRWRDLDTSYALGVSAVTVYDMYGLDAFSPENPWTRREDNSFITMQSLHYQGPAWAEAIYDYLYPLNVYDTSQVMMDSIVPGQPFFPQVWDFDQREKDSIVVSAFCNESSDSEIVILYPESDNGFFAPGDSVPTNGLPGVPGDGIVSLTSGGELWVSYVDHDMPSRICERILSIADLGYVCGDVNNDSLVNIGDVIYLINFLYRAGPPPDPLEAADVNYDGLTDLGDVVFLINYLYR